MSDDAYWDDVDDIDDAALAELDQIELAYTQQPQPTPTLNSSSSHSSHNVTPLQGSTAIQSTSIGEAQTNAGPSHLSSSTVVNSSNLFTLLAESSTSTAHSPAKRRLQDSPSSKIHKKAKVDTSPSRFDPSSKAKQAAEPASSTSRTSTQVAIDILAVFEREIICCICDDIFICPLSSNACSHTFCAPCWDTWKQSCLKSRQPFTCPNCRNVVSRHAELHSNYIAQSIVTRFVEEARERGLDGWGIDGEKRSEREAREREWKSTSSYVKDNAPTRNQPRGRLPPPPRVFTVTGRSRNPEPVVPLFLPDDDSSDDNAWSGEEEEEEEEEVLDASRQGEVLSVTHIGAYMPPSGAPSPQDLRARRLQAIAHVLAVQPVTIGTASTSGNRREGGFRPGRGV